MSTAALSESLRGVSITGGTESTPFPAPTKEASGMINGTQTEGGRLSQWIQVPLSSASPTSFDTALPSANSDLLPLGHLTPKTLLGAGGDQRETIGQLYATQIATLLAARNPEDTRTILLGLGLMKLDMEREAFFDMLDLVRKVI